MKSTTKNQTINGCKLRDMNKWPQKMRRGRWTNGKKNFKSMTTFLDTAICSWKCWDKTASPNITSIDTSTGISCALGPVPSRFNSTKLKMSENEKILKMKVDKPAKTELAAPIWLALKNDCSHKYLCRASKVNWCCRKWLLLHTWNGRVYRFNWTCVLLFSTLDANHSY